VKGTCLSYLLHCLLDKNLSDSVGGVNSQRGDSFKKIFRVRGRQGGQRRAGLGANAPRIVVEKGLVRKSPGSPMVRGRADVELNVLTPSLVGDCRRRLGRAHYTEICCVYRMGETGLRKFRIVEVRNIM